MAKKNKIQGYLETYRMFIVPKFKTSIDLNKLNKDDIEEEINHCDCCGQETW